MLVFRGMNFINFVLFVVNFQIHEEVFFYARDWTIHFYSLEEWATLEILQIGRFVVNKPLSKWGIFSTGKFS